MEQDAKRIRQIKMISGALIVGFTLIIVYVIISAALSVKPLKITNFNQIDSNLTNGQLNELEDFLWQAVTENEEVSNSAQTISALIRPSSYEEIKIDNMKNYSFLVDIDEFKLTYRVGFTLGEGASFYEQPDISCPAAELMKYPETYCSVGRTTATSVEIGNFLPYEFRLESGELVTVSIKYTDEGKDYLNIRVSSCGNEEVINRARAEVKQWILSHDFDPDKYEIRIPEFCDGEGE